MISLENQNISRTPVSKRSSEIFNQTKSIQDNYTACYNYSKNAIICILPDAF